VISSCGSRCPRYGRALVDFGYVALSGRGIRCYRSDRDFELHVHRDPDLARDSPQEIRSIDRHLSQCHDRGGWRCAVTRDLVAPPVGFAGPVMAGRRSVRIRRHSQSRSVELRHQPSHGAAVRLSPPGSDHGRPRRHTARGRGRPAPRHRSCWVAEAGRTNCGRSGNAIFGISRAPQRTQSTVEYLEQRSVGRVWGPRRGNTCTDPITRVQATLSCSSPKSAISLSVPPNAAM
jgi:hypothetical protein